MGTVVVAEPSTTSAESKTSAEVGGGMRPVVPSRASSQPASPTLTSYQGGVGGCIRSLRGLVLHD
eukprot:5066332-Prorocentrum_lima.AAC.1